jgi:hypothetical protein
VHTAKKLDAALCNLQLNRKEADARRVAISKRRDLQRHIHEDLSSGCTRILNEYRRLVHILSSASSSSARKDTTPAGVTVSYSAAPNGEGAQDELTLDDEVQCYLLSYLCARFHRCSLDGNELDCELLRAARLPRPASCLTVVTVCAKHCAL